mmetsp:Transcript_124814/g.285985  ORF Transcript_124814/g.285985 Transcript_124814/m.285985 type:complete len:789 (+) Transcript_124814:63-2429(+)|eukprot:CAMPEP_0204347842 /NCGR_PEP_ID=MMETSP0469-20131031/28272_1 /ASSEMBLY_ACC=CAM_ASM_000384 /TAXON_ID=2969 /ORGANISM="Oxyrrhis marina" /LENGTH=788 /DNA_ID=CAMNT_0051333715 /DNA_START=18 /DNA_END=2384 /DNA_ORIENTATION=-
MKVVVRVSGASSSGSHRRVTNDISEDCRSIRLPNSNVSRSFDRVYADHIPLLDVFNDGMRSLTGFALRGEHASVMFTGQAGVPREWALEGKLEARQGGPGTYYPGLLWFTLKELTSLINQHFSGDPSRAPSISITWCALNGEHVVDVFRSIGAQGKKPPLHYKMKEDRVMGPCVGGLTEILIDSTDGLVETLNAARATEEVSRFPHNVLSVLVEQPVPKGGSSRAGKRQVFGGIRFVSVGEGECVHGADDRDGNLSPLTTILEAAENGTLGDFPFASSRICHLLQWCFTPPPAAPCRTLVIASVHARWSEESSEETFHTLGVAARLRPGGRQSPSVAAAMPPKRSADARHELAQPTSDHRDRPYHVAQPERHAWEEPAAAMPSKDQRTPQPREQGMRDTPPDPRRQQLEPEASPPAAAAQQDDRIGLLIAQVQELQGQIHELRTERTVPQESDPPSELRSRSALVDPGFERSYADRSKQEKSPVSPVENKAKPSAGPTKDSRQELRAMLVKAQRELKEFQVYKEVMEQQLQQVSNELETAKAENSNYQKQLKERSLVQQRLQKQSNEKAEQIRLLQRELKDLREESNRGQENGDVLRSKDAQITSLQAQVQETTRLSNERKSKIAALERKLDGMQQLEEHHKALQAALEQREDQLRQEAHAAQELRAELARAKMGAEVTLKPEPAVVLPSGGGQAQQPDPAELVTLHEFASFVETRFGGFDVAYAFFRGDGPAQLDLEGFKASCVRAGWVDEEEGQTQEIFEFLDADCDGLISEQEFMRLNLDEAETY